MLGVATYRHAATVYDAGSGESGTEALMRRSMSLPGKFVHSRGDGHAIRTKRKYLPCGRPERRRRKFAR